MVGGQDGEVAIAAINEAAQRAATDLAEEADLELDKRGKSGLIAMLALLAALHGYDAAQIIFDGIRPGGFHVLEDPRSRDRPLTFGGIKNEAGRIITPALQASARATQVAAGLDAAVTKLEAGDGAGTSRAGGSPPKPPKGGYAVAFEGTISTSAGATTSTSTLEGSGTLTKGTPFSRDTRGNVSISVSSPEGTCGAEGDVTYNVVTTKRGKSFEVDVSVDDASSVNPPGGLNAEGCLGDLSAATISLLFGFPPVTVPAKGGTTTASSTEGTEATTTATITLTLRR